MAMSEGSTSGRARAARRAPRPDGGPPGRPARRTRHRADAGSPRSIRAVSSLRSRSSEFGQGLQQLDGPGEQPGGLGVRPASLLGLARRRGSGRRPLGLPRQVEVLGDERRLGAPSGRAPLPRARGSPAARRAPGSRRRRRASGRGGSGRCRAAGSPGSMIPSVGEHARAARSTRPRSPTTAQTVAGVEGRPDGRGDLDDPQVDPRRLEPPREQLLEPQRHRFGAVARRGRSGSAPR